MFSVVPILFHEWYFGRFHLALQLAPKVFCILAVRAQGRQLCVVVVAEVKLLRVLSELISVLLASEVVKHPVFLRPCSLS